MAFWKDALEAVGGFDPQFRVAGDDVDICWRLQERGWTLGFCAAAMVWHRRRDTVGSYLRQQQGYGRAEALLERKWPERYNRGGHLAWAGRVYGATRYPATPRRNRIRYGSWGSNLFQSVYDRTPSTPGLLPLMPEWYLLIAALAAVAVYDVLHDPLLFRVPMLAMPVSFLLLGMSISVLALQALRAGAASARARPISQRAGLRPRRSHGRDVRPSAARPARRAAAARTHSMAAARRPPRRSRVAAHDPELEHDMAINSGSAGEYRGSATTELHAHRPWR